MMERRPWTPPTPVGQSNAIPPDPPPRDADHDRPGRRRVCCGAVGAERAFCIARIAHHSYWEQRWKISLLQRDPEVDPYSHVDLKDIVRVYANRRLDEATDERILAFLCH